MPTIRLKPKSAEFDTGGSKTPNAYPCDMPGCLNHGEFRAPRDRSLSEHYQFCQGHITEYNRAWNFFDGMNPAEVEEHVIRAFYGDRPTWKYREYASTEEALFDKIDDIYDGETSKDNDKQDRFSQFSQFEKNSPEVGALAIMGLEPPITLEDIKKEYKILAKKYHPDHNKNDPKAEDVLKNINMAYTILKAAYGKYENMTGQ